MSLKVGFHDKVTGFLSLWGTTVLPKVPLILVRLLAITYEGYCIKCENEFQDGEEEKSDDRYRTTKGLQWKSHNHYIIYCEGSEIKNKISALKQPLLQLQTKFIQLCYNYIHQLSTIHNSQIDWYPVVEHGIFNIFPKAVCGWWVKIILQLCDVPCALCWPM